MAASDPPPGTSAAPEGSRPGRPRIRGAAAALLAVFLVAAGAFLLAPRSAPVARTVDASASEVLLKVSDIPETGWGEWASGASGSGAWRFFAVHNELILATLNVTLWVEPDGPSAQRSFDGIVRNNSYPSQDGGIPGADASAFWTFSFGQYAGMVVRRYNVIFVLSAHLESSFALTKSDLGKWSGWQLAKVESHSA